jgi:hypothetical protein
MPADTCGGVEKDHWQSPMISVSMTRHLARHEDGLPVIFQAIQSSLETSKDRLLER